MVVDPAVRPGSIRHGPVMVPLAAGAPAAELPLAEPAPLCASANEPVSANVAATAIVANFIVVGAVIKDKLAINVSSSARWDQPSRAQRRVYAAAIVSHRLSLGLELASDVAMSAEPVALHSLKWEAIST